MKIIASSEFIASGGNLQPFGMVENVWAGKWCWVGNSSLTDGEEQIIECTLSNTMQVFAQTTNPIRIGLQVATEENAPPALSGTVLIKEVTITLPQTNTSSTSSVISSSSVVSSASIVSSSSAISSSSVASSSATISSSSVASSAVMSSSSVVSSSAAAVGNAVTGKTLYESSSQGCVGCHNIDGSGLISAWKIDATKTIYGGTTLANYITANMPQGGVGKCDTQCGLDIAAHIQSWAAAATIETASTPIVTNTTHTISLLNNCGQGVTAPGNGYSFIGDYNTAQSNQALSLGNKWNHTVTKPGIEWANTQFAANPSTYNIPANGKANDSCNNVDTLDVVLVKKYANWNEGHSNGFEPNNLLSQNINFGKIASIVLDVKVNAARTLVPTQAALIKTYNTDASGKPYLTAQNNITAVDNNKVNLAFTLQDNGASTVLSASDIIEINQSMFLDQWIRVVIDMSKIKYCSTTNYNCTAKTPTDLANTLISKLTVVAESSSGGVLRGSMPNVTDTQWNSFTVVPETFKEIDVSIKKLELIYK